jgi:hypothetical protein
MWCGVGEAVGDGEAAGTCTIGVVSGRGVGDGEGRTAGVVCLRVVDGRLVERVRRLVGAFGFGLDAGLWLRRNRFLRHYVPLMLREHACAHCEHKNKDSNCSQLGREVT